MNHGHWSFPKGHVENDESEYETAYREVKEETNIDCIIIDGFREVNTFSPYNGCIKNVIYFVADYLSGDVQNQEEEVAHSGFYFVDEALSLTTYDNDKEIFKKAVKFVKSH